MEFCHKGMSDSIAWYEVIVETVINLFPPFSNAFYWTKYMYFPILIQNFDPKGPIPSALALDQAMAWRIPMPVLS